MGFAEILSLFRWLGEPRKVTDLPGGGIVVDTHVLLHQHAGKEAMLRFLDARHNTSVFEAVMQVVVDLRKCKVQHLFVLDGATSKGKLAEKEKRKLVFSKALADLRAAVDTTQEEVVITSQCALGHFTGRDIFNEEKKYTLFENKIGGHFRDKRYA